MSVDHPLVAILPDLLPEIAVEDIFPSSGQRIVFLAQTTNNRWSGPNSKVVVKVTPQLSASQIAYLQQEIRVLNDLSSPHYPKLYFYELFDVNPRTGDDIVPKLFVSIEEYIESQPLKEILPRYNSSNNCVVLLRQLVAALTEIWTHPRRIVHRDLKPANILVRSDGSIAIIDLGIVREEGSVGLTATGAFFGPCTPGYGAPEQLQNKKNEISFRSDLFSLGVIAYEAVSGANPFLVDGSAFPDILHRTLNDNPTMLHELGLCDRRFSEIVAKLMAKQPFERYRTIERLNSDIEAYIGEIEHGN